MGRNTATDKDIKAGKTLFLREYESFVSVKFHRIRILSVRNRTPGIKLVMFIYLDNAGDNRESGELWCKQRPPIGVHQSKQFFRSIPKDHGMNSLAIRNLLLTSHMVEETKQKVIRSAYFGHRNTPNGLHPCKHSCCRFIKDWSFKDIYDQQ